LYKELGKRIGKRGKKKSPCPFGKRGKKKSPYPFWEKGDSLSIDWIKNKQIILF